MTADEVNAGGRHRTLLWRARLWGGLALLLAGLTLLGYVGWELYGTNIVSKRDQVRVTQELTRMWSLGEGLDAEKLTPTPTASPHQGGGSQATGATGGATSGTVSDPYIGQPTALIRIPKFGPSYVVPVFEGTSDAILARGFAHFPGTAGPGQVGNYALAAHRITHGEPLRNMPDLRPGDEIIVETRTHIYTYVLDTNPNNLIVNFTQNWVLYPLPHNPKKGGVQPLQQPGQALITLTTCSELFHTDNRMVAFGHLVSATKK